MKKYKRYKASCSCKKDRLWGLVKRKRKLVCSWCKKPLTYEMVFVDKNGDPISEK